MVTYSKYGTASYNIKVLINNTIANRGMTDTGFHTVTLSRNLHIPWLIITKLLKMPQKYISYKIKNTDTSNTRNKVYTYWVVGFLSLTLPK